MQHVATRWWRGVLAFGILGWLAGCAHMPSQLAQPVSALSLAEVRTSAAPVQGQRVRWGGVIAAVENRNAETWLELVEQPLGRQARPQMVDLSGGRFMVKVAGFLDPTIYAKGRELTVVGSLDGMFRSTIGKGYHYDYPVVAVSAHHLWPPRVERDTYYVEPAFHTWGWPGYRHPWGWYDPFWPSASYRVDVRRPSGQPGPGPAATPAPGLGTSAAPAPAPEPPARPEDERPKREGRLEP